MPDFISQRRRLWYVEWDVPKGCRHAFDGKARIVRSLGTDSRAEALIRSRPIVDHLKAIAEKARGGEEDRLAARADYFRRLWNEVDEADREIVLDRIDDEAERYRIHPEPDDDPANYDPGPEIKRFYALATGRSAEVKPLIDQFLASRPLKLKTQHEYRATLNLLAKHHSTLEEVNRKRAASFVDRVLVPGRSVASVQKATSVLFGFWNWAQNKGHYPEAVRNPWSEQAPAKVRKRGVFSHSNENRRPFTEDEAQVFLSAVIATGKKHPADPLLVMMMAVTGMRLEEVCALLGSDVSFDGDVAWLTIREGKTAAASRRLPVIDSIVVAALRHRALEKPTLPLFPELPVDRYGKRSQPASKRLGRLLREYVKDHRLVAAHGWRHRGRDLADKNGIEPWTADWFFGHARPGEGFQTYTQTPSNSDLLRVAAAIPLPKTAGTAPS